VRSDPPDPTVLGQVKHHRVAHPQRPDATVADHDTASRITKLLAPAPARHAPVHSGKQDAEILLASEDHAAREGGYELGIRRQQVQQRPDVVPLGGIPIPSHGVVHTKMIACGP
jgi:hypothetical protein